MPLTSLKLRWSKVSYTVYKHTSNVTGKSYIGLTKHTMDHRWNQHKNRASNDMTRTFHFMSALRKYGYAAWTHEVLEDGIPTLEEANAIEVHYIEVYSTFVNGYNSTLGGDGVAGRSGVSSPNYGVPKSEYVKDCLRRRMTGTTRTQSSIDKQKATQYANRVAAQDLYEWYNPDIGHELLTIIELGHKYSINISSLNALVKCKGNHCEGWQLKNAGTSYRKYVAPVYTFVHNIYGIETCTAKELCSKYSNLTSSNLNKVGAGKRTHHKGWKLCI